MWTSWFEPKPEDFDSNDINCTAQIIKNDIMDPIETRQSVIDVNTGES